MPQSVTSIVKTVDFILKTPALASVLVPVSKVFTELSGYRKIGLRFDDLIAEETPIMQKAISRLPASESYARNFRIITAHQCTLSHQLLPLSKQVKPEEDVPYLIPYILEAEAEAAEKKELDEMVVVSKK
ncbi:ubiquinol--cytochrome-c reductase subunit 7 [Saccharomycopsis crataegensis]|uniref:Cytochrome b-c1 complex subunit 7 n=1 Tax=Saccharomycopsis crataegensis TaxID=43959 RepID=A0AAV5QER9_9ASCO|nr:ubiquinol--cytochrome-c reductase subunit 7 [Saccharomycopsis crataegensis]